MRRYILTSHFLIFYHSITYSYFTLQLHEIGDDELDADIESEVGQTREQQEATLRRRIEMVKSSIQSLTKASLQCK